MDYITTNLSLSILISFISNFSLFLNSRPSPAFYEAVCSFPLLYFMVGSFKK